MAQIMLPASKLSKVQFLSKSTVARLIYAMGNGPYCAVRLLLLIRSAKTVDAGVAVHQERTQPLAGATVGVP